MRTAQLHPLTLDTVCKTDGESRTIQPFCSKFVEPLSSLDRRRTESVAEEPVDDSMEKLGSATVSNQSAETVS